MFKSFWSIVGLIIAGLILLYLVLTFAPQFSAFGAALMISVTSVALLWTVDTMILHNFDTLEELKNGNVAVGLALVAYAIVVGCSIISAFSIFR